MRLKSKSRTLICLTLIFVCIVPVVPLSIAFTEQGDASAPLAPYHYHTYQEMTDELHSLQQNNSDIMALSSLGKTAEGRDIWLVTLSDNVSQQKQEPGVLLMGAHHGNEKPSYEILIFFIEYMVDHYNNESTPEVRNAFATTQIYLIPMVNPDGVEANTRKNCAPNHGPLGLSEEITSYGVNLNRNYADNWFLYYIFPMMYGLPFVLPDSSMNYRGPSPFSENETRAVRDFADTHDVSISISYHTFGQIILYPWMHTTRQTPDEPIFRSVGENISKINRYELFVKQKYLINRPGGTLGTSENWLYREHGIISYTVELCTQRVPTDPQTVYQVCITETQVHLYLCQRVQTIAAEKSALDSTVE